MEGLISTFHIDWKLMIAQVVNFVLVFLALYFLAVKPLKKVMQERGEEINNGILNGEKNKELLENTKKEYDQVISKARSEANILLKETKKQAENKKNEIIEDAKKEVEKMIESGKKNLESEKNKMMNEVKKDIVSIVIKTTEKVSGSINKDYEKNIIKELNNL